MAEASAGQLAAPSPESGVSTQIPAPPPNWQRPRVLRMIPSPLGVLCSAAGYYLAIGPSLLPRTQMTMIVIGAIGVLVGYAIGAVLGATARLMLPRIPRPVNLGAWVAAAVAWIAAAVGTTSRMTEQVQQQQLLGIPVDRLPWLSILLGSVAVAYVFLLLGRLIRRLGRGAGRGIAWFGVPRWVALTLGTAAATLTIVAGFLVAYEWIKDFYAWTNDQTTGQTPPTSPLRSGSRESIVGWEQLGAYGRQFVTTGPSEQQLAQFNGGQAKEPIRAYVGLDESQSVTQRAELAVRELRRTGAFERGTLVVTVPTGTGWMDPDAVNAAELMTGGDIATVGVQYSFLPSWLSFIVDQGAAQDDGEAVVRAIVAEVDALPAKERPTLILFGESLGAFGGQGAFPGTDRPSDVVDEFDGVVWTGPPAESTLWRWWRLDKTGGESWAPVIAGGDVARVGIAADDFPIAGDGWGPRRISFAAHPNDPVVYWSPTLALNKPNWLSAPIAPTVSQQMRWVPLITFWQCGIDLMVGGSQPVGIAHNYTAEMGPQWASVLRPPGWSAAKEQQLQGLLDSLRGQGGLA